MNPVGRPFIVRGWSLVALFVTLVLLAGCGQVHRRVQFTRSGAADPVADKNVSERYKESVREPASADASKVVVMIDTLPPGVTMKDDVLSVEPGFDHEVIGKFVLGPDAAFFYNYRDGWRSGYCHPQQILFVGTLFIWGLVPLYYPCYVDANISKVDMVEYLKKLGVAAGGDLIIASYVGGDAENVAVTQGFVLRADPRLGDGSGEGEAEPETEDEAEAEPDAEPKAESAGEAEGGLGLTDKGKSGKSK